MRASSLRLRSTCVASLAICVGPGTGLRSSRAKISWICGRVIAGVFFPKPVFFQLQEPQSENRQGHMVMPAHPTAHFVLAQAHFPFAILEQLLNCVPRGFDRY